MKKLLCMALCLIMVFSLCACGGNTATTNDSSDSGMTITDTDTSTTNNSSENNNDEKEPEEYPNKVVCAVGADGNNIVVKHNLDENHKISPDMNFSYPSPTSKYDEVTVLKFTLPLENFANLDYQAVGIVVDSMQEITFGFVKSEIYEAFTTGELRAEITYVKDLVSKSGITYKVYEHRHSYYYFGSISEDYAVVFRGGSDEPLIDSIAFTVEKQ